jgi:hypothetical protein
MRSPFLIANFSICLNADTEINLHMVITLFTHNIVTL